MRPVKRSLMELNPEREEVEEEEEERYGRAVMEIGDHISSSVSHWHSSEERTQWKR